MLGFSLVFGRPVTALMPLSGREALGQAQARRPGFGGHEARCGAGLTGQVRKTHLTAPVGGLRSQTQVPGLRPTSRLPES